MTTQQPRGPGWYPDPSGRSDPMYWDGEHWILPPGEPSPAPGGAAAPAQLMPYSGTAPPAQQPPTYAYKNPVLYAIGGLFFPPLVLFLMGGDRKTCLIMLGIWVLFLLTVWIFGLGAIFALTNYIWSVVACHQEAVKQNRARGFVP
ncbi:MAG: DUF2510 domain-containing protein [Nocardia sp.]|nr:DUF2510 domain-containing protein [Nocardia sp.]